MTVLKVKNIPINLHYSWFIAFGLITWGLSVSYFPSMSPGLTKFGYFFEGVLAAMLFFMSILLHELGHSFVAMRHGIKVESITLYIFGGVAKTETEARTPLSEFWLALAGPLVSISLAGLFFLFDSGITRYLFYSNVAIGVLNLIPIFPLDGGRILRAILWRKRKSHMEATERAVSIGMYLSSAIIGIGILFILLKGVGFGIWLLVAGGLLIAISNKHYKQLKGLSRLAGMKTKISDIMIPDEEVVKVPFDVDIKTFIERYFTVYGYHGYPVIDGGNNIVGMVTFKLIDRKAVKDTLIKDTMIEVDIDAQKPDIFISPTQTIADALVKIVLNNYDRLFVYDGSGFAGIITKSMIVQYIQARNGK